MDPEKYNLVILGGGAAAFAAATKADELGRKTLMINAGLPIGGTCVNVGCVPSKLMLTVAGRFYDASHPRFRSMKKVAGTQVVNFAELIREKDEIVASARRRNYTNVMESMDHVRYVEGRAEFLSADRIGVKGGIFAAEKVLIATGASTRPLAAPGMDGIEWHSHRTIMNLGRLPRNLLVIGGGPEGLEFAQMFSRLGSKVTVLVTRGHKVLRREEPEVVQELLAALLEEGIRFVMDADIEKVSETAGRKAVTIRSDGQADVIEADEILVAAGLKSNTSDMGLEAAGVKADRSGFVEVNEHFETTVPGIYAAGDCIGTMHLETVAAKEGALAAENALSALKKTINYDHVPHAVFTSPQLASVGLTEKEEMRRFGRCMCRSVYMDAVPKAGIVKETRGVFKMVIHPEDSRILGVHIVASNAADLIHEAALAVKFGLTVHDIIDTLHVFPTLSEGIKRAAQAFTRDVSNMACCVE